MIPLGFGMLIRAVTKEQHLPRPGRNPAGENVTGEEKRGHMALV